jgi:hypothetical protein
MCGGVFLLAASTVAEYFTPSRIPRGSFFFTTWTARGVFLLAESTALEYFFLRVDSTGVFFTRRVYARQSFFTRYRAVYAWEKILLL